jgi:hypothetical protein
MRIEREQGIVAEKYKKHSLKNLHICWKGDLL